MVNPVSIAMKPGIDVMGCFAATASVVKDQAARKADDVSRGFACVHNLTAIFNRI